MTDTAAGMPPTGPSPISLAVAMELVTKHRLRLADQRDSRLGPMAGRYELAAAGWTGKRSTLVAFYRPPSDPGEARADLAERYRQASEWGAGRMKIQSTVERCDVLLVALGPVPKPDAATAAPGPVRIGAVALNPGTGDAELLFAVPGGLPGVKELRRHARAVRRGVPAPSLAAVDLAERQTIQGGYNQPARRALDSAPVATYTLIGICVAIWVVEETFIGKLRTHGSSGGVFPIGFEDFGAAGNGDPLRGDWWRYFSSIFLHATTHGGGPLGFYHIVGNMAALYFFGRIAEQLFGRLVLLGVFLITGAGGVALWVAVTASGALADGAPTIGASGGIAGIMGFLLMVGRVQGRDVPVGVTSTVRTFVLRNLLFTAVFWVFANGVVNNWAHLGGALSGAALGCVIPPKSSVGGRDLRPPERVVLGVVIAVAGIALAIAAGNFVTVASLPPGFAPEVLAPQ